MKPTPTSTPFAPPLPDGLSEAVRSRLTSLRHLIGNTPLIEIAGRLDGERFAVFAKQEAAQFTGSIKDRMALHILESAYARGEIAEGDVIAEATSGNTGIAFAALGRALLHPVRIFMPDWMSRERVLVIRSLGAVVIPIAKDEGGFLGSIERADAFEDEQGRRVFRPHQFDNQANVEAHYLTTGPELLIQMRSIGVEPAAFVAGVGTGGTVMGVGRFLRQEVPGISLHPLEPANSPTLRTGCRAGHHRIQGISDEFIPSIVQLDELDEIVDCWDGDAILMAQRLGAELGLAVGISSGANVIGAIEISRRLGKGAPVATVLPDCNKKYLSTDLVSEEKAEEGYITPRVRFDAVRVHPRPCCIHAS